MNKMLARKLQILTDEAIKNAIKIRKLFERASVNWADIKCVDVQYVESLYDDPYYKVIIEEASPSNSEFHSYILNRLSENGYNSVKIETEW